MLHHDVHTFGGNVASMHEGMDEAIDGAVSNLQQLEHATDLDGGIHHN